MDCRRQEERAEKKNPEKTILQQSFLRLKNLRKQPARTRLRPVLAVSRARPQRRIHQKAGEGPAKTMDVGIGEASSKVSVLARNISARLKSSLCLVKNIRWGNQNAVRLVLPRPEL